MVDEELEEKMIGRLVNWKFGQAMQYHEVLKEDNSLKCLELLEIIWGDTGWERGDTVFGQIVYMLVEYIRMKEEWAAEEFYNGDEGVDVI